MAVRNIAVRCGTLLLAFAMLLSLSACGLSRKAKIIVNKIDSLEDISLDSGPLIGEIDSAYQALPEWEKRQVGNLAVLDDAKRQYNALKEEEERRQKNETTLETLKETLRLLDSLHPSGSSEEDTTITIVRLILMLRISQLLV